MGCGASRPDGGQSETVVSVSRPWAPAGAAGALQSAEASAEGRRPTPADAASVAPPPPPQLSVTPQALPPVKTAPTRGAPAPVGTNADAAAAEPAPPAAAAASGAEPAPPCATCAVVPLPPPPSEPVQTVRVVRGGSGANSRLLEHRVASCRPDARPPVLTQASHAPPPRSPSSPTAGPSPVPRGAAAAGGAARHRHRRHAARAVLRRHHRVSAPADFKSTLACLVGRASPVVAAGWRLLHRRGDGGKLAGAAPHCTQTEPALSLGLAHRRLQRAAGLGGGLAQRPARLHVPPGRLW